MPSPDRTRIRTRILDLLKEAGSVPGSASFATTLVIFLDLSLELEALGDLTTLCVLIPDICCGIPTSLYLRGSHGNLALRRTTITGGHPMLSFPEPTCPSATGILRDTTYTAIPLCGHADTSLRGVLCLHQALDEAQTDFFLGYVRRTARILEVKQAALSNRQRLAFITSLVRDIGHNVIVPNMEFKLLFLQMDKQVENLTHTLAAMGGANPHLQNRALRHDLPLLVTDLRDRMRVISRRFHQASLFLESLLRRSHFDKGAYDLVMRPCQFKSQIIEPQLERFRPLLLAQNIHILIAPDVRIDEDIVLDADLGLIAQVLANLLANAVKYTRPDPAAAKPGEKTLLYGWETLPHAFGPNVPGIMFFVSTSGPPIADADALRLFEANFRATIAPDTEGSGHGLFFVKQIVELHRGRVGYSRTAAMNSFHFTLPCSRSDRAQENDSCPRPS